MVSGSRLTCLLFGHSHYNESVDQVVAASLSLLRQQEAGD